VTGVLSVNRSGGAFVRGEDGRELFVRERAQATALPGDSVAVRPDIHTRHRRRWRKPTGRVVRVLQRARRDIVGTLRPAGRHFCVVPIDPVYTREFHVDDAGGAKPGERVVMRFVEWHGHQANPRGEVVEVLGPEERPSVDTVAVMRHYGLCQTFPEDCMRDAESASRQADDPGKRRDIRDLPVVTIDPERAKDFDDALSLERGRDGQSVLGVHIADVSHFVRPGTAIDREARRRGTSVYLPDRVIPMLPEQLSNGVCSLAPDVDRLAFSAFLTVDSRGKIVDARLERTIMRSARRYTYEEVQAQLDGDGSVGEEDSAGLVRELHELAARFRQERMSRHALDLDVPECEIDIGPDGALEGIRIVGSDPAHQLVEECMLAANEAVARHLSRLRVPFISRVHEAPDPDRLEDLAAQLDVLGVEHDDLSRRENLSRMLTAVKDSPLAPHVRVAVLRSMNRAEYSVKSSGHYGLAKRRYCHFTSPIRRYPDLVVHRLLAATLAKGTPGAYEAEELAEIARESSVAERQAEEAERSLIEIMKLRFLRDKLAAGAPPECEGVVVEVARFGMFVELPDLQVRGLVHVSSISDRHVRFSRKNRTLRAGDRVYGIGSAVHVIVAKVDMDKRRIDFGMVDG